MRSNPDLLHAAAPPLLNVEDLAGGKGKGKGKSKTKSKTKTKTKDAVSPTDVSTGDDPTTSRPTRTMDQRCKTAPFQKFVVYRLVLITNRPVQSVPSGDPEHAVQA